MGQFLKNRVGGARVVFDRLGVDSEVLQDVFNSTDESGAVPDHEIRSEGQSVPRTTRDGQHIAPLIESHAGGDQGAAFGPRLHHDHGFGQTHDDPIAGGELRGCGRRAGWQLRYDRAAHFNSRREALVFARIDDVDARPEDGECRPLSGKRSLVGGAVDPAGETRNHLYAVRGQAASQIPCDGQSRRSGAAGPHDRHPACAGVERPAEKENRRRIVEGGEGARIKGRAKDHHRLSFPIGLFENHLRLPARGPTLKA